MNLTQAIRIMSQAKVQTRLKPGNVTQKHFEQARKVAIEAMKELRRIKDEHF